MEALIQDFRIDGRALPAPDAGMEMKFEDIDAADAGRDESGFMHRSPVRRQVGVWSFHYSWLSAEGYAYLRQLLTPDTFTFTCPDGLGGSRECTAYVAAHGIARQDKGTGMFRNVKFNVIEC